MTRFQKINFKDSVEDGQMDLSLLDIQDVPVKEIANFKNVYNLDLSNNHLVKLPKSFPTLTNILKLDLSKNQIKCLPKNFGEMTKLMHLDLYKNDLHHLPMSFANLKWLRWLDLKDNPLVPAIQDTAGQCLDSKQCQECASSIVLFFRTLKEKIEDEKSSRVQQKMEDKPCIQASEASQKSTKQKKIKKKKVKFDEQKVVKSDMEVARLPEVMFDGVRKENHIVRPYVITSFLVIVILVFLIASMDYEKTLYWKEIWLQYWKLCLEKAQSFGFKTVCFINDKHQRLVQYIVGMEKSDYFIYFVNKFKTTYQPVVADNPIIKLKY